MTDHAKPKARCLRCAASSGVSTYRVTPGPPAFLGGRCSISVLPMRNFEAQTGQGPDGLHSAGIARTEVGTHAAIPGSRKWGIAGRVPQSG